MMARPILGILAVLMSVAGCTASAQTHARAIVFIADGAGTGHWTVARIQREQLAVDEFPVAGLVDTRDHDGLVTESAASATAYSIGLRTFRGALGIGPDSEPHLTALERAREHGLAVGLLTTTAVTDATPAAFAVHYHRRDQREAARQLASQHIDVILSGGRARFATALFPDSTTALAHLKERSTYVESAGELHALDLDTVTVLVGLLADGNVPLAGEREPSLAEMTRIALTVLDRDPQGFFLLIENGETDTQAHANRPFETLAAEMEAFDDAIRVGLEYQRRHPETLLLVLADHETGGITVHADEGGTPTIRYAMTGHTGALVPLFAKGPGAEAFGGLKANEEVGKLLAAAVGG